MEPRFKSLSTMNDLNLIVPGAFKGILTGVTNVFTTDKKLVLRQRFIRREL